VTRSASFVSFLPVAAPFLFTYGFVRKVTLSEKIMRSRTSTKPSSRSKAQTSAPLPGRQGRVKDPKKDRRLAANRTGSTGQGRVADPSKDRRLAVNRDGSTGQGRVKNPKQDRRLAANRNGPTGQGSVKVPERDKRLRKNRFG